MTEEATTAVKDGGAVKGGAAKDGAPARKHRRPVDFARVRARAGGIVETLVRWVGSLASLLMLAHIVLTVGQANPDNAITQFVATWAKPLALGFSDLFTPADPVAGVAINYGVAAVFWLFATSVVVRIIRAVR